MKNSVKFISHRGESHDAPENTLAAFRLAFERGTDGVECDVHLTSDKQVVVAHDLTTQRMGYEIVNVESAPYSEIKTVAVSGSHHEYPNQNIPLLSELLDILPPGVELYLELKGDNNELVDCCSEILHKYPHLKNQITIISFNHELLKRGKALLGEYKFLLLTGFWRDEKQQPHPSADELIELLQSMNLDGVDAYCDESVVDKAYVKKIQAKNYLFAVWTIDHCGQGKRFIEFGVDALTSNRAARLRAELSK